MEIERLLVAQGARTWNELHPDEQVIYDDLKISKACNQHSEGRNGGSDEDGYTLLSNTSFSNNYVPKHSMKAYGGLCGACFAGDNEKVRQLCLPARGEGKPILGPLNISVEVKLANENKYSSTGWTPLYAALAGRRWSTAKLIVAIATAQYKSDDDVEAKKFGKFKIDIDSDSDSDSGCESDDSDATIEKPTFNFVDIASRPSEVTTDVHPKKMLSEVSGRFLYKAKDGLTSKYHAIPLLKAIYENDMQTFVHVANLYQSLPTPLEIDTRKGDYYYSTVHSSILVEDNVNFLDEYIRRTGYGVQINSQRTADEKDDAPIAINDKDRIYLGLNVQGKKRADLARKNDPDVSSSDEKFVKPLLWDAIDYNAKSVVEYLSTDKPLAAY